MVPFIFFLEHLIRGNIHASYWNRYFYQNGLSLRTICHLIQWHMDVLYCCCRLIQLLKVICPGTSNHLGMDMISLTHVLLIHVVIGSFMMDSSLMRKHQYLDSINHQKIYPFDWLILLYQVGSVNFWFMMDHDN